jgi:acetolactate synthase-1/2/3 large subunit
MSEEPGATITVGAALAEGLARAGVKVAFTVPGESVLSLLEGLAARRIRVVAARHEGSAAFMAESVAQLTGRPAVCIGTRAVGATNLAVGLHAARADSAPVIAIVGQVRSDLRGREAFQEMDLVRAFEPIVKWAVEIKDPGETWAILERAVAVATRGRPGPVLLSVPADVMDALVAAPPVSDGKLAASRPDHHVEPDPKLVRKILHLLTDARRPLIIAGAGVLRARSTDALVRLAETMRVPVVASWRRADVFPNDHPLYLGMTGNGAPASLRVRLDEADALLVLGSRLGEMTTFGYQIPGPGVRWAQVDAEPRGAPNRPEIILATDVAMFLRSAQRVLGHAAFEATSLDERTAANVVDRAGFEAATVVDAEAWDGPGVHPGRTIATLARILPADSMITSDAGDFGTWAARGLRFHRPGTFIGSTAGPMGFALPAAIGAVLARPGRLAVALAGDGGFAMTMADLETAVRERARLIAIVFDNGRYGAIWRDQNQRGMDGGLGTRLGAVDFAAVADACGALGLTVQTDDEFEPALRQAMEAGRPALLHLTLDPRWTTVEAGLADVAFEPEAAPELAPAAELEVEPEPAPELAPAAELEVEPEPAPPTGPVLEPETAPPTGPVLEPEPEPVPAADVMPAAESAEAVSLE